MLIQVGINQNETQFASSLKNFENVMLGVRQQM